MTRVKDITGQKFGQLTALSPAGRGRTTRRQVWRCLCDCGQETFVEGVLLRNGHRVSCGCRHGQPRRGDPGLMTPPDCNCGCGFPKGDPACFWSKVAHDPDGCWLWTAFCDANGYGKCNRNGEQLAHRVAYKLIHKVIPDGLDILHRCDNPTCVRPAHLYAGTHQQNMRDRDVRGRTSRGTKHAEATRRSRQRIAERIANV